MYFVKCKQNKIFFDLLQHIEENYRHYRMLYSKLHNKLYLNDFAFSTVHIMNNRLKGDFVNPAPGKLYYTIDKDKLHSIKDDTLTFLLITIPMLKQKD